jgi:2-polyprenyl-3-methyl-5-hydroxy-6-metoxy-1,4-benzoquinol methylase
MSGLTFSSDAAEKLIAAYQTPDLVRQRDATLRRLNLKPGERVIDVGCGPGFLCESMAVAVGPTGRVVGIDISEDLIDFATKHKHSDLIEYRRSNATALPAEPMQFDVAVSTQVIEYVADADAALREIARVLRPGGRAIIVDTDFDSWVWHAADAERMAQIMKGWEMHCADPRLPRTLIPRLRAVGLLLVDVEGYPIINTTYRSRDFSHVLSHLIADFLLTRGFEKRILDDWLADLLETEQRSASFFSLNRYFFAIEKVSSAV